MTMPATPTSSTTEQTFRLPDLGEGLTEAEIVRWLVAEGDLVTVDQSVVEVETAKSLVEVPTPYAGRVATLHADEGTTLEVGSPLVTIASHHGEPVAQETPASPPSPEGDTHREEERAGSGNVLIGYGTADQTTTGRRRRPRGASRAPTALTTAATRGVPRVVSPLVRRIASEHNLDLHTIEPSGPGGVIRRVDVDQALATASSAEVVAATQQAAPERGTAGQRRIPLSAFRKAASTALSRSRREIPEATVWVDVDATALWDLRESTRSHAQGGPGLLAHIARFVIAGLKQFPVLNARLDTDRQEIVEYDRIHLGLAVQSERGLVVPAVMGADSLTTHQLDNGIHRIAAAAREGRLTAEELSAATFTLNNYGSFRVDGSAAIINHPQVAILGIGRIIDRPWVVGGELCIRKVTQLSFAFDHRVCDGGTAAGFMRSVADAIENPISAITRL